MSRRFGVAEAADVSFLDNRKYLPALEKTRAGAVIVRSGPGGPGSGLRRAPSCTTEVYAAWARVAALFHPPPPAVPGVHPSAVIGADARIDPSAEIGPLAVIGDRAVIGRRTRIAPLAVIGAGVEIGADCRIGSHASVSHAIDSATGFMSIPARGSARKALASRSPPRAS